jgi:hypothetical protein
VEFTAPQAVTHPRTDVWDGMQLTIIGNADLGHLSHGNGRETFVNALPMNAASYWLWVWRGNEKWIINEETKDLKHLMEKGPERDRCRWILGKSPIEVADAGEFDLRCLC